MREIRVLVRPDRETAVLEIGREHGGQGITATAVRRGGGGEASLVVLHLANDRVGDFVEAVERGVEEAEFTLIPRGSLPFATPLSEVQRAVRRVEPRSTLELILGSLQSIGSWRSLLLYALFSGLVAAYAVIFSTGYLLVAAMLIAPVGAPGLVSVVGLAVGDLRVLRRGLLRFWISLAVLSAAAVGLGFAYGLQTTTPAMEEISSLSMWSVLLALVGGAAGAQALVQSDRDSLVTATAAGFLVAVALSPPAAVLGLAGALERWDMLLRMAFLLVLTYAGLLVGGWGALLVHGVRPGGEPVRSGGWRVTGAVAALALVVAAGMVALQAELSDYRRADLSRRATALALGVAERHGAVSPLEADARFAISHTTGPGGERDLLLDLVVSSPAVGSSADSLEARLRDDVSHAIRGAMEGVSPHVQVTVLQHRDLP